MTAAQVLDALFDVLAEVTARRPILALAVETLRVLAHAHIGRIEERLK